MKRDSEPTRRLLPPTEHDLLKAALNAIISKNMTVPILEEGEMETCYECSDCGTTNDSMLRIGEDGRCFNCVRWRLLLSVGCAANQVIIGHQLYVIGSEPKPGQWNCDLQGMGGREFTILHDDGRVTVTHNLWWEAPVPDHLRDVLVDNARFQGRAA